jgi:hypothetical protein
MASDSCYSCACVDGLALHRICISGRCESLLTNHRSSCTASWSTAQERSFLLEYDYSRGASRLRSCLCLDRVVVFSWGLNGLVQLHRSCERKQTVGWDKNALIWDCLLRLGRFGGMFAQAAATVKFQITTVSPDTMSWLT